MECNFTFKHFGEILELARNHDYDFLTLSEYYDLVKNKLPIPKKLILLRHDIDDTFERTKFFLEAEKKHNIKATYFFRLHSYYNIFSFKNYSIIKLVSEMNHEVGLHTEIMEFVSAFKEENPKELLKKEIRVLETILGKKIRGITPHRDIGTTKNSLPFIKDINLGDFNIDYHSYDKIFNDGIKYVNEGLNPHICWRDRCPCKLIGEVDKMYILTHPRWWFKRFFNE